MPESPVNVTNLATGVPIAAELCTTPSTTAYVQQIKILGSSTGSLVPIPADGQGMWVQIAGSTVPQVAVSGPVQVSGAISVSVMPAVSGTVSVSGTAIVSVVPGVSVSVGGLANVVVTTTATSGVSGPIVWLGVNQTLATLQTLLGTVGVTVLGGPSVTIQQGVSVSLGSFATVVATTTATSGVTGPIVWLGVNQTLATVQTLVTVLGTVAVNVVAGGAGGGSVTTAPPSISASGQIFWVAGGQSSTADPVWVSQIGGVISTVATVLGTVAVNVVAGGAGGGSVTTAPPSISASGQIFWVAGGQSSTADPVWVSQIGGTIATVLTIVTQLGTQIVSIVPGPSVTIQQGASVSLGSLATVVATTTATSGVTGPIVWLGVGQTLATVQTVGTVLGTIAVNIVAGGGSVTTAPPSISQSGQAFWVVGGQSTTAFPVFVSQINPPGGGGLVGGYMLAVATTSAMSSSTQIMLQSVYVSTGSTLGTSGWTIGAGSALMVYGLAFGWSQAAANMQATFMLMVTNSATTLSTVTPAWAQVTYSTAAALSTVISTGFVPGTVVGINSSLTTIPFPWVIPGPAVVGFAVAATSSGATVYASINADILNTVPIPNVIAGTANVSGTVVVSGAIVGATTQTAITGPVVWFAPTQTVSVVSTIVTILGTQIVTLATGGTVATLLGTVAVNIVAGAGGGGSVTTTTPPSNFSAQVMRIAGGQDPTAPPVFVSQINPPAAGGGSVVTTQAGGTSTGQLMWLAATQTLASISTIGTLLGTVNIGGSVAISGTGLVSLVPGVSVTIVGLPVTISGIAPVTTQTSVSISGLPVWWQPGALIGISVSQALGTVITVLGTVQISGTVNVSSTVAACIVAMPPALLTNSGPSASAQGLVQWVAGGQSSSLWPVFVSTANPLVGGDLQAIATTTALSSSTQVLLQSVYINSIVPGSTLGTSGWTIGAGSALMVYGLGFGWSQAAANMQATFVMMVTTSGTTLSTVTPAFAQVTFSSGAALSTLISTGFVPGTYHGLNTSLTTVPFPWVIQGPAVVGFAVAATSSGATVYATLNAAVINTIPFGIMIAPGASVAISGAVAAVTTQSNATGAGIWLAPTQTVTVTVAAGTVNISSIVPVTTAASVSVSGVPVWINPTQTIAVSGLVGVSVTIIGQTIAITGGSVSTTQPPSGVTGVKVWPGQPVNIPVMIMVTSTAVAISANAYLMTVWTGSTVATAGVSLYAVPAGQNLRLINNLGIVTTSAVVGGTVQMVIAFGTNAASLVSGSVRTQGLALLNQIVVASTNAISANVAGQADVGAGATIAPFIIASTAAVLQNMVVNGFLF